MNFKEEQIFKIIINYVKENKTMPSLRFIQKKAGYKSINSISQYLKSLEKKGYLLRNNYQQLIIDENTMYNTNIKRIKIINKKNKFIYMFLNKKKNYLGYQITNNYFSKKGILKNDALIVVCQNKLQQDDLGLFLIDNQYRIMNYEFKDGFYLLRDNEILILNKVHIIGKVIQIFRTI